MAMNSAFRRSVKAETKKTGKGGRGGFFEKWRFHKDSPSPILLIDGGFVNKHPDPDQIQINPTTGRPEEVRNAFFGYPKHTRKIMRNGNEFFADEVCSAGDEPHNPKPCVGCHGMDTGDKSTKLSEAFTFTIVHLHPYHGHPVLDDNGQIRMRGDGKGALVNYEECTGRQCNYCRTLNGQPLMQEAADERNKWPGWRADQLSTMFGQRRYIEIGKNHLADIGAWEAAVGSLCGNDGSQLVTEGFKCPICQSMVIDMSQDPRNDEQIAEAVSKPYPCMQCNRPVILQEISSCDVCKSNNRPHVQHNVFDVVLWGMRSGEGTASHLVLQRSETIEQFANSVHPAYLGGKTFRDYVADLAKPHNFEEMFAPRSLAEQSKRLGLPVPAFGGGQQQQGQAYGAYGAQGGGQQQGAQPPAPVMNHNTSGAPPPPGTQQQPQAPAPGNGQVGAPGFVPPGRQNFST